MEPIKPIEGTINNSQDQATALTEVMRERYWHNKADQATKTVQHGDESAEVKSRREGRPDKKAKAPANALIHNTYAEFTVDSETHEVIVRIFDGDSGDLIRTLPPEKLAEEIAKGNFRPEQIRRRNIRV